MNETDKDFFEELLSMFKIEAEEHLKKISNGLIELEKCDSQERFLKIIDFIYKETHSLKGAARAVNMRDVETICQTSEDVFSSIKQAEVELDQKSFDVLHKAIDSLNDMILSGKDVDISDLLFKLKRIIKEKAKKKDVGTKVKEKKKEPATPVQTKKSLADTDKQPSKKDGRKTDTKKTDTKKSISSAQETSLVSETIRVSTSKLDSIMLEAEEMLIAKLSADQQTYDIGSIKNSVSNLKIEWEKQINDIKIIRKIVNDVIANNKELSSYKKSLDIFDFIDNTLNKLKNIENRLYSLSKLSEHNSTQVGTRINTLLEDVKKVLMLPFSTLLKSFPKIVRDISREQKKEVDLVIKGSTIEVDRRILEEMKDPFIHLLRNCIDHGMESPKERIRKKKDKTGIITISITQKSNGMIEIILSDDGAGIDTDKVKDVAVKRGLISAEEAEKLSENEKKLLVFETDISTSPIITDVSGRGLGLPIVREKIGSLGGSLQLESKLGKGTSFIINLPVTLATFRGIVIIVNGESFVIPTSSVERVIRVKKDDIKTVKNRETITYNGAPILFARMNKVLKLQDSKKLSKEKQFLQTLIITHGNRTYGFAVDEIISEQEVLVKNLGTQLNRVPNVSGVTMMGSGKIVPILNVSDVMRSAIYASTIESQERITREEKKVKKSILIAEDSITSRTLLKNIFRTAGYTVKATVDGAEAYTAVTSQKFDLVVSDIEMPRMNGFELVSKIRTNKHTKELPVVLVTGLESDEDKKRGIDVGADAYIVKRSFDQSNLLNVVNKLI
ncbi:MAG: response regulator [bacterium]